MIFRKNKQQSEGPARPDKQVHRMFQIGALVIAGYILYGLYTGNGDMLGDDNAAVQLTDEEINDKVQAVFKKMAESPEYKKMTDFVQYMESNTDKKNGNILKVDNGIIIYVPSHLVGQVDKPLILENDIVKVNLTTETKQAPADAK